MKLLVITPIAPGTTRSGGAEIYVCEVLKSTALKYNVENVILTSNDGGVKGHKRDGDLNVVAVRGGMFLFPLTSLPYIIRFARGVDAVVENVSKFPLIIPLVVAKILGKPFIAIVHHIHGRTLFRELPPIPALFLYLYEMISIKIYAIAGVPIITVSNASRTEIHRFGFKKLYVVYPGIRKLANPHRYSKALRPLLIYVGRVKKYKQVDHFLKVCRYVLNEVPEAKCLVVGKGDARLEGILRHMAFKLGISDKARIYVTEVSDGLKHKIMSMGWLYVFTSMKEGFGLSVLEALNHGTPVIAYDIPPLREVVGDGGHLVRKGSVKDLARVCVELIRDRDKILALSQRAIERAKNFSINHMCDTFYKVIRIIAAYSRRYRVKSNE